jgi:hypothetical protein
MKTSLGVDCVATKLDYDAVKEVVHNYGVDCERQMLSLREQNLKFALRFSSLAGPGNPFRELTR